MNLIRAVENISDSVLSNFQRAMENHQYAKGESSTISTEQATEYIADALRLHGIRLREESLALAQKKAADEFRRTSEIRSSKPRVTLAMGSQSGKTWGYVRLIPGQDRNEYQRTYPTDAQAHVSG